MGSVKKIGCEVLTAKVRDLLQSYGVESDISVAKELSERVHKVGLRVIKEIGGTKDDYLAQGDALTVLRKKEKIRKKVNIISIESVQGMRDVFGIKESAGKQEIGRESSASKDVLKRSGVVLVTNDKKYVPRANILFTSPTGDTGWKEVARMATKRTEIRAYVHKPEDGSVKESLISLVDLT
nr:VP6 [Big Cypress virus]